MHLKRRAFATVFTVALLAACGQEGSPERVPPVSKTDQSTVELICSYAPSQSNIVSHVASASGGSAAAAAAIAKGAGLSAVVHSSGAYIFTGAGGYLAGTLGTAIVGPILVGVGVAIGGSAATVELLCVPQNHPDMVEKVEMAAKEFFARTKVNAAVASEPLAQVVAEVKKSVIKAGSGAFEYASRKSVEVSEVFGK